MRAIRNYLFVFSLLLYVTTGLAVRCYMCSSNPKAGEEAMEGPARDEDNCGAYRRFNKEEHIAVECNSEESPMPGSFCMKITQQSPIGFIWDGRWRQVIRRCASVADTGVTGVCNWGVYDNGIYWEECYCSSDECNTATNLHMPTTMLLVLPIVIYLKNKF